jgi:hypothetical protein
MGERDSKQKSFRRGGEDKPAAPPKEAAGMSGMARRFATVEEKPVPKPTAVKPGKGK